MGIPDQDQVVAIGHPVLQEVFGHAGIPSGPIEFGRKSDDVHALQGPVQLQDGLAGTAVMTQPARR